MMAGVRASRRQQKRRRDVCCDDTSASHALRHSQTGSSSLSKTSAGRNKPKPSRIPVSCARTNRSLSPLNDNWLSEGNNFIEQDYEDQGHTISTPTTVVTNKRRRTNFSNQLTPNNIIAREDDRTRTISMPRTVVPNKRRRTNRTNQLIPPTCSGSESEVALNDFTHRSPPKRKKQIKDTEK